MFPWTRKAILKPQHLENILEFFSAALIAFLALGTLGMLALAAALALALFGAFIERGFVAFAGLAAAAGALVFFGGANPLAFALAHPATIAASFFGYFLIGAAWSVFKFRLYTGDLSAKFAAFQIKSLAEAELDRIDQFNPAELSGFRDRARNHMDALTRSGHYPAMPGDHKSDIFFWMGWWPVSAISFIVTDPIKRLMDATYRLLSGVYVKIANDQATEYKAAMGMK